MNIKIFILIILCLFICFLIVFLKSDFANYLKKSQDTNNAKLVNLMNYGDLNNYEKLNCDLETVYSMIDEQCRIICLNGNFYISNNGVCVNFLNLNKTSDSELIINKCDAKKGLVPFLIGDPLFGTTAVKCLSIDLGIQPDNIKNKNIICKNGLIDIDYRKEHPQLKNCKCKKDDEFLTIIPNTSNIRTHGVCVSKKNNNDIYKFYKDNDLLFNEEEYEY